uniref:Bcl-2-like protein 15 n=1 Tax=Dicentrarchus labrax TaxID=13489 RepID=A0A8C4HGK2_DICLA
MYVCISFIFSDVNFDPVVIADKLRSVADSLNEDVKFKAALSELRKAAAQEVHTHTHTHTHTENATLMGRGKTASFSRGVDILCQTHAAQKAEVASEVQLIKASVTFGLYVIKSSPELKSKVQNAMTAFLNRHVRTWVTEQGGWVRSLHITLI